MLYGALEAGGTKMICAVGDEKGNIIDEVTIPTTVPNETIPEIIRYFKGKDIEALGIACFGPLDLDKSSPTYGNILKTPKLAWTDLEIYSVLKDELEVPVNIDTDVAGSLLGEATWGSAKGISDALYITIGTGIGGGILANGEILHGMLHPELGHMLLSRHESDSFEGICPFHKNCFEGLASGPSIEARWGKPAEELADKVEVWNLESYYIAQALTNIILTICPKKIILGGGVMNQEQLFPMIRMKVRSNISGYITTKELEDIDNYIVPAGLGGKQGIMGALKLAFDSPV
ncbi:MAG: ROK family protein [Eubacterium sp.]|nr:ROK family protein [Eubacterium sp.]